MKNLLVLALVLILPFSAFAGGSVESGDTADDAFRIALIIENTIDDKGWCQSMHDGITQAIAEMPDRNIEYSYAEKLLPVDAGSIARQYVAEGYDLIIAHGAQYKNLVMEIAEEYPDVSFAFGTSSEIGPENVFTYMPESEETGYINGLIAGTDTKVGIVGLVGPVDSGDSARYNRGYVLGVQAVNPDAKILVAHTGSFSDYVKSSEVATSQLSSGADILTGSSQQAIGALRATAESPTAMWVGQDLAQLTTEEGKLKCIAASAYNYAAVVKELVEKIESGTKGGECIPMNFANGGFVFDYNPDLKADWVSPELEAMINEAIASFKADSDGTLADWAAVDYSTL